jgi:dUTP pyrophosphatase
MRPNSNEISWALQDAPVFTSVSETANWLIEIRPPDYRGMLFHVGPNGRLPQRTYEGDAGYDLFAAENVAIPVGTFQSIRTDVSVALPANIWARITGRSSTWRKYGLITIEGVIDTGYRGELLAGLYNLGQQSVTISAGDRIAQLIPHLNLNGSLPIAQVSRETFDRVAAVDNRGSNGFGSTGN